MNPTKAGFLQINESFFWKAIRSSMQTEMQAPIDTMNNWNAWLRF